MPDNQGSRQGIRGFIFNAGWIVGLRLANVPLQFILFTVIAWHYSLAEVGVYALFNAAWFFARQLGPMGMEQSSLRFIPALLADDREAQSRRFERRARQLVFVTVAAISSFAGMGIFLLDLTDLSGITAMQFTVGLIALPGYALVALMSGQFRAHGRVRAGQWPDSILFPIIAMAIVQLAHMTEQDSLLWLLGAHALAIWSTAATYWLLSRSHLAGPHAPLTAVEVREIYTTSMTIALGSGVNVLANRLPLIFVSIIIGTPAAALYEAAQRIGALATLGTWAAGTAVSPMLSDAHARKQANRMQDLLIAASWTAFLPALLMLMGVIPWGGAILSLFGSQYADAHWTLVFLVVFAAINASAGLASHAFNMTGHQTIVLRFNAAQLLTILIFAPLLIHLTGIAGAALAVMLAAMVRDVGMGFLLPTKLHLSQGVWSRLGGRRAMDFAMTRIAAR